MSYGLYIHLPFCRSKCPYCGFTSITGGEGMMETYADAVSLEIRKLCTGKFGEFPRSIYIGGGTPSIVPVSRIKKIIGRFLPINTIECTVEANPESMEESWLDGVLNCGVNRISIGVQSLDDSILRNLGRIHSARQAKKAILCARRAGFENISVDLMFGVPGQTMKIWQNTLNDVLELQPEHISCYSLGIEEDTGFFEMSLKDELKLPDSSEISDMYIYMTELVEASGLLRYEISNFSRPGYECRHNMAYWDFSPYLGVGASAHSFDGRIRRWNESNPEKYIERCLSDKDPVSGSEVLDDEKLAMEMVMLCLRTRDGISIERILSLVSSAEKKLLEKIETLIESGFLERYDERNLRLTTKGIVISGEIIAEIASEIL